MTKEEINRQAKNYSEQVYYTTPRNINADVINDFTAGAEWMQGEMEKDNIECRKRSDGAIVDNTLTDGIRDFTKSIESAQNAYIRILGEKVGCEEYIKLLEQQVIDLREDRKDEWIQVTPFTTTEETIHNVVFELKDGSLRFGSFLPLDQWDRPNMFVDGAFHKVSSVVRYLPITPPKTKSEELSAELTAAKAEIERLKQWNREI